MKRLVSSSIVALALSAFACGGAQGGAPPPSPPANDAPSVASEAASAQPPAAPASTALATTAPPSPTPSTDSATPPPPTTSSDGRASEKKVEIDAFQSSEPRDKGICWAIPGTPTELAEFNKDRKKNLAAVLKKDKPPPTMTFKVACPTDKVVGKCESVAKWYVSYYAPTFTVESAKKHCSGDQMGTWME